MIFLDANYIISLFIENHEFHERAKEIDESLVGKEQIISRLVISEVITILNIRLKASNEVIERAYHQMHNYYEIIEDHYFYDKGLEKILKYDDKDLSLFDCVYMAIMEELGIKQIVTFDKHFNNKGIRVIGY
ncbi:MAG: PIN domain-containing protein [Methanobrevibacter sp.]|jgi:predicted nucleic acid-binding protein|nr:PIN domain-containing protein [Methanobrevibacter sp.]